MEALRETYQKDAGNYTSNILVNGLDELKEGENVITLKLAVENHEAKTYTINAVKEKKEEYKLRKFKTICGYILFYIIF